MRRARTEDLSEVEGIGCLYQSGFDRIGRPVIVFCGKWFPAANIDLEKVSTKIMILTEQKSFAPKSIFLNQFIFFLF